MIFALFEAQTTAQQVGAAVLVAGLFLVDQVVWLLIVPVRTLLAKRIDGHLRARVRAIAAEVSGLDVLESEEFQDRAARAVDAGRSGWDRERSAGNAAVGQLELALRLVSALIATALLATFSVPIAVGLLALALTLRALVRRRWMVTIGKLDAETASHRYEYYLYEQAVHGAHQEVRLFGLSDWFAALDPIAEHELFQLFVDEVRRATGRGAVTVLVSHRFTTIRMADLIVVLEGGRIVEQGSHDELMAAGGGYAELYRLQERAYR